MPAPNAVVLSRPHLLLARQHPRPLRTGRHLRHQSHRPDRPQRHRQVHPAQAARREGRLTPTGGSIAVHGGVDYLPQSITLDADATLADLLGVRPVRDAVRAIESGDPDPAWFDLVGDDWDIEGNSAAALAGSACPPASTGGWAPCPAARPSSPPSPASGCGGRPSHCWTSRPTTSTRPPADGCAS